MSHVPEDEPTESVDAETASLAHAAEQPGFDEFWIAQHPFMPSAGHVPSPFVFLAHLGAHVLTLTFGVAVVALSFEDPIRLAEDIATTQKFAGSPAEHRHWARNPAADVAAFGITAQERLGAFEERYVRLLELLQPASDAASGGDDSLGAMRAHRRVSNAWLAVTSRELLRRVPLG